MTDGERTAGQYNLMAVKYAADNADGAFNAYYERPATISARSAPGKARLGLTARVRAPVQARYLETIDTTGGLGGDEVRSTTSDPAVLEEPPKR